MKLIFVLVIIGVTIVASDVTEELEVTTKDNEQDGTLTNSEERHTLQPVSERTNNTAQVNITSGYKIAKKPVFKIVQKAKLKHENYWKTATKRPPVMKNMKFVFDKDGETKRNYDIDQFRKTMSSNKDDSSEEDTETTDKEKGKPSKETMHVKTLIRRFHKLGSKISREKNLAMNNIKERVTESPTVTTIKSKDDFDKSSDENDDREFIFVTPKTIQEQNVNVEDDSDESGETTTIVMEKELKLRQKRSINVIEEENFGTTVSGFKFTGKVGSMNSDFIFRNINT